jgi:hypothetical protein
MTREELNQYQQLNRDFIEKHKGADLLEYDLYDPLNGKVGEILRAVYLSPAKKRADEIDACLKDFFKAVAEEQRKRGEDAELMEFLSE